MANLSEAIEITRTLLNDNMAQRWADSVLVPKAKVAHRQLQQELALNDISVLMDQTAALTVNIGDVSLGSSQPSDMVQPIDLKERDFGSTGLYDPMIECRFLPSVVQESSLIFWAWYEEKINFIGALSKRDVQLRYLKSLATPSTLNDAIGVILGENYIGPQTAFLATGDVAFSDMAKTSLDRIIRTAVKQQQGMPVRRLPYRYRGRRRIG